MGVWDGSASGGGDRDGDGGTMCFKGPQIRSCGQAHPLGPVARKTALVRRALCDPSRTGGQITVDGNVVVPASVDDTAEGLRM